MQRVRSRIANLLFGIVRGPIGQWLIGWVFAHASGVLPVRRRYESKRIIAFDHPRPSYPVHILIVPKKAIVRFEDIGEADLPIVADAIEAAQHLISELGLAERDYRLIVNGGAYQDVKQLHIHLIAE